MQMDFKYDMENTENVFGCIVKNKNKNKLLLAVRMYQVIEINDNTKVIAGTAFMINKSLWFIPKITFRKRENYSNSKEYAIDGVTAPFYIESALNIIIGRFGEIPVSVKVIKGFGMTEQAEMNDYFDNIGICSGISFIIDYDELISSIETTKTALELNISRFTDEDKKEDSKNYIAYATMFRDIKLVDKFKTYIEELKETSNIDEEKEIPAVNKEKEEVKNTNNSEEASSSKEITLDFDI